MSFLVDILGPNALAIVGVATLLVIVALVQLLKKDTKPALDPNEFREFPLVKKTEINHNTAVYRFALPNPTDRLGLPIGQHVSVTAVIDGKAISRSYTPTSSDDDRGFFDLLVKTYPEGNISRIFAALKQGDSIKVRGPKGQFNYTPNMVSSLGMIAGGTGITPMLQIIRAIIKNPSDRTLVSLIFANVNEGDILLREELDKIARDHSNIKIHYVLNNPPPNWTGSVGFVSKELIKEHCPQPSADTKILICGPPPMVNAMCKYTEELGFEKANAISKLKDQVFKF